MVRCCRPDSRFFFAEQKISSCRLLNFLCEWVTLNLFCGLHRGGEVCSLPDELSETRCISRLLPTLLWVAAHEFLPSSFLVWGCYETFPPYMMHQRGSHQIQWMVPILVHVSLQQIVCHWLNSWFTDNSQFWFDLILYYSPIVAPRLAGNCLTGGHAKSYNNEWFTIKTCITN